MSVAELSDYVYLVCLQNHLDLHAVLWLEAYLVKWPKTFIVVSHAREFLNTVMLCKSSASTCIVSFYDYVYSYILSAKLSVVISLYIYIVRW